MVLETAGIWPLEPDIKALVLQTGRGLITSSNHRLALKITRTLIAPVMKRPGSSQSEKEPPGKFLPAARLDFAGPRSRFALRGVGHAGGSHAPGGNVAAALSLQVAADSFPCALPEVGTGYAQKSARFFQREPSMRASASDRAVAAKTRALPSGPLPRLNPKTQHSLSMGAGRWRLPETSAGKLISIPPQ
jgi:hypothetical protein